MVRSSWSRVNLNPMTGALTRANLDLETQDTGGRRHWSDVATSQGFLAITRSMPETPLVLFTLFNDRILSLWPRCPQLTLLETIFTSLGPTTFPPPASESLHSPTLQVTEKAGCFLSCSCPSQFTQMFS